MNIQERFEELETKGLVKVEAYPEIDSYFDVYGEPEGYTKPDGTVVSPEEEHRDIEESINTWGLNFVVVSVKCRHCENWSDIDSIGMIISENPLTIEGNPYMEDMMESAITRINDDSKLEH